MMRAISTADLVSNPCDAEFTLSVISSCSSCSEGVWIASSSTGLLIRVAGVKVAMFVSETSLLVFYRPGQKRVSKKMRRQVTGIVTSKSAHMARSVFVIGGKLAAESVVEARTQLANRLIRAIRPGAVCQQGDGDACIEIDPEGSPGESKMTNRPR